MNGNCPASFPTPAPGRDENLPRAPDVEMKRISPSRLLVRGGMAFYNPPTHYCVPWYRCIRCRGAQQPRPFVSPPSANEQVLIFIQVVPRSIA